ncbi:MAG: peptidoglycan DD-metalloendopeptidase family protein [bacterium]
MRGSKGKFSWIILFFVVTFAIIQPTNAQASVFSFVTGLFASPTDASTTVTGDLNSQTAAVLQAVNNINPEPNKNRDIAIVDDSAIETEIGPMGTASQIASSTQNNIISVYTVKSGDTLSEIASMFNVSKDTVLYANDLKSEKDLKPGMQLVILPVSGIYHTVIKGETLNSIAKKFKVDPSDILSYNDFGNATDLKVGMDIVIPGAEEIIPVSKPAGAPGVIPSKGVPANLSGYLSWPVSKGAVKETQKLHGKYRTAIDLASLGGVDVSVRAAASGFVLIARASGWNGGYGNYIVIQHSNGLQTLYAHLSEVSVSQGQSVGQGDSIGKMGDTGNSTGTHLHFELWGTVNGWKVKSWNPFN